MSVLLVEDTGVPGESQRPVASHLQTLSHNVVSITSHHERDSNSQLSLMIYRSSIYFTGAFMIVIVW